MAAASLPTMTTAVDGPVVIADGRPAGTQITGLAGQSRFGCRISGMDLAAVDGNPGLVKWVYDMVNANRVLVFAGQNLKPMEFSAFGKNFAKPEAFRSYEGALKYAESFGEGWETFAPWKGKGHPNLMIVGNIDSPSLTNGVLSWEGNEHEQFRLDFSRASGKVNDERTAIGTKGFITLNGAAHWHTDMSFDSEPSSNTILYCKIPPLADQSRGGRTSFIDLTGAYQALPVRLKTEVDGLICGHADLPGKGLLQVDGDLKRNKVEYTRASLFNEPGGKGGGPDDGGDPAVRWNTKDGSPKADGMKEAVCFHPLVRPHPMTGVPTLYSPCGTNCGVVGWSSERSFALLSEITAFCLSSPAFRYDHPWTEGDVVFYDTAQTLHRGNPLPSATCPEDTRLLLRISNQGYNPTLPNVYQRGVHFDVAAKL